MTAADDPPPTSSPDGIAPEIPLLTAPADGVAEPITTQAALDDVIAKIRNGTGPIAVDAERASGYRYSQRAYLIQMRRAGLGTVLIDPIEVPDLSELNDAIGDAEWILHAANQDLPCLDEVGLRPARLFDTELAGRLLGAERVALGTMVEQYLGVRLEKGHSAADWSTRPLPHAWLVYAALDVELLVDLRAALIEALTAAGKLDWASQEFEAVRIAPTPAPRSDPWRRTSGIHKIRNRRQLATIRSLWNARDRYAAERDVAAGRILSDAAIIEAARTAPKSAAELGALSVFGGPRQRRQLARWFAAIEEARALPDTALPPSTGPAGDGIPPPARWRERDPAAAVRLNEVRSAVNALAVEHDVLAQNLLASDVLRRLCWQGAPSTDEPAIRAALAALGARPWQIELTAAALSRALEAASLITSSDKPDGLPEADD